MTITAMLARSALMAIQRVSPATLPPILLDEGNTGVCSSSPRIAFNKLSVGSGGSLISSVQLLNAALLPGVNFGLLSRNGISTPGLASSNFSSFSLIMSSSAEYLIGDGNVSSARVPPTNERSPRGSPGRALRGSFASPPAGGVPSGLGSPSSP